MTGRALSTAEVSRLIGLTEAQVRSLVRSGLCRPGRHGRRYAFDFQDLVVLRAAKGLLDADVPAVRVQRALSHLVSELSADQPLSGLRIFADGRRVAVQDEGTAWLPETGQTLLDFGVDELAEQAEAVRREALAAEEAEGGSPAEREFNRAIELEGMDVGRARAAYLAALELDPRLADAYVNLGRLVHESGDMDGAVGLYLKAAELEPDDPVIQFNLALALEDGPDPRAAVDHYERALELDPEFADAHYNLGGVFEQLGHPQEALRHYAAYKRLTEG